MKLCEIQKLKSGVYVYTTSELVTFLNTECKGLGSHLFNNGYFDVVDDEDSVIYNIEQAIEDQLGTNVSFSITDIVETQSGRQWHVINI